MRRWFLSVVLVLAAVALGSVFTAGAAPSQQPVPTAPAPTWTPGPPAPKGGGRAGSPSAAGSIELCVRFGELGLEEPAQQRVLWTAVQWQDGEGRWHDVEGWQGLLDEFGVGEGCKRWIVSERELGAGPFRWMLYRGQGGELLAASQAFALPSSYGETVRIEVPPGSVVTMIPLLPMSGGRAIWLLVGGVLILLGAALLIVVRWPRSTR